MSLIKNLIPPSPRDRIRRIKDWDNAGQGTFDGQKLEWTNSSGTAVFTWDQARSFWFLQSTGGEYFLWEDWSSGIDTDTKWTVTDASSMIVVNSASNRIEYDVVDGVSQTATIRSQQRFPLGTTLKCECSLNGITRPTSDYVYIENGWVDFDDDGDGLPRTVSKIQTSGNASIDSWQANYKTDVSNFFHTDVGSLNLSGVYDCFSIANFMFDGVRFGSACEESGGVPFGDDDSQNNIITKEAEDATIEIFVRDEGTSYDDTANPYSGRIWLKR